MSRYTQLKDKLVKGQWIFTCAMKPLQFSHFLKPKDLSHYDKSWLEKTQEEQDDFINDDFETVEGSHHSISNCSCKPISEEYAKWFLENKMDENYVSPKGKPEDFDPFEVYENIVKTKAAEAGIEYEGI